MSHVNKAQHAFAVQLGALLTVRCGDQAFTGRLMGYSEGSASEHINAHKELILIDENTLQDLSVHRVLSSFEQATRTTQINHECEKCRAPLYGGGICFACQDEKLIAFKASEIPIKLVADWLPLTAKEIGSYFVTRGGIVVKLFEQFELSQYARILIEENREIVCDAETGWIAGSKGTDSNDLVRKLDWSPEHIGIPIACTRCKKEFTKFDRITACGQHFDCYALTQMVERARKMENPAPMPKPLPAGIEPPVNPTKTKSDLTGMSARKFECAACGKGTEYLHGYLGDGQFCWECSCQAYRLGVAALEKKIKTHRKFIKK